MTLVEKVKMLAANRGISISRLEKTLGLSNNSIAKWDRSAPAGDKLLKVARYFGVTTDYLLSGSDFPAVASPEQMEILKDVPATHFHLLQGIKDLDLSDRDVEFLVKMAREYKIIRGG